MARRPAADERQADIFGASLPARPKPEPRSPPARQPRRKQAKDSAPAPRDCQDAPAESGIDALAARLSPAELEELAAALTDETLAHLALAAVRQIRRRLARVGGKSRSKGRAASLERAARQLATELGGIGVGEA